MKKLKTMKKNLLKKRVSDQPIGQSSLAKKPSLNSDRFAESSSQQPLLHSSPIPVPIPQFNFHSGQRAVTSKECLRYQQARPAYNEKIQSHRHRKKKKNAHGAMKKLSNRQCHGQEESMEYDVQGTKADQEKEQSLQPDKPQKSRFGEEQNETNHPAHNELQELSETQSDQTSPSQPQETQEEEEKPICLSQYHYQGNITSSLIVLTKAKNPGKGEMRLFRSLLRSRKSQNQSESDYNQSSEKQKSGNDDSKKLNEPRYWLRSRKQTLSQKVSESENNQPHESDEQESTDDDTEELDESKEFLRIEKQAWLQNFVGSENNQLSKSDEQKSRIDDSEELNESRKWLCSRRQPRFQRVVDFENNQTSESEEEESINYNTEELNESKKWLCSRRIPRFQRIVESESNQHSELEEQEHTPDDDDEYSDDETQNVRESKNNQPTELEEKLSKKERKELEQLIKWQKYQKSNKRIPLQKPKRKLKPTMLVLPMDKNLKVFNIPMPRISFLTDNHPELRLIFPQYFEHQERIVIEELREDNHENRELTRDFATQIEPGEFPDPLEALKEHDRLTKRVLELEAAINENLKIIYVWLDKQEKKCLVEKSTCNEVSSSPQIGNSELNSDSSTESVREQPEAELSEPELQVVIGPNGTKISHREYQNIPWDSAASATKQLLILLFGQDELSASSRESLNTSDGHDESTEGKLNLKVLEDIISVVSSKCYATKDEIHSAVIETCLDEFNSITLTDFEILSLLSTEVDEN